MSSLNQLSRLLQNSEGGGGPPQDAPQVDTAEQIYISSLALIKMLKHGALLSCSMLRAPHVVAPSQNSFERHDRCA